MRPIIKATYSRDKDHPSSTPPPPPPVVKSISVRKKLLRHASTYGNTSCTAEEKKTEERTGKEQIAEQTVLLKSISDQLGNIRVATERNTATNSALLVLLTHVLKGEDAAEKKGGVTAPTQQPLLFKQAEKTVDSDSKSLGSDADLPEDKEEEAADC